MNCPACGRKLSQVTVAGVVLDVCQGGCGGIWFDQFELKKSVRYGKSLPEPLTQIERNPAVVIDTSARRMCPKCAPIMMQRRFSHVKGKIEVDECPKCGGIWLDAGEMEAIQCLYASDDEKRQSEQDWREGTALRATRSSAPGDMPDAVLPYLSRKIHYNPLGVINYRSADSEVADIETWRDRIENPPDTWSPWATWGAGLLGAAFFIVGGLRICLMQNVVVPVRGGFSQPLHFYGAAATGKGLMAVAIGLFLHFHFFWGTSRPLQRFSTPGKIASVLILIVGAFLFLWKAWV